MSRPVGAFAAASAAITALAWPDLTSTSDAHGRDADSRGSIASTTVPSIAIQGAHPGTGSSLGNAA
jgi:hypothetical protein